MKTTKTKSVYGTFNECGYEVNLIDRDTDTEIYQAGNHPSESTVRITPEDGKSLALSVIRAYCVMTCKEMAKENNAKYSGVVYVIPIE